MPTYSAYNAYQDSPAPWMGKIPNTWTCVPLKHIANFVNGNVFPPNSWTESGIPIIRIENLNGSDRFNYCDSTIDERHHVNKGDLLFGWSGNRGTSFGPFRWNKDGLHYLNQHIFKVATKSVNPNWLYWCLKAVTTHVEEMASGIIGMVHITKGELGSIKVCVPTEDEQLAISRFLDIKTAQIDALLAKQQTLLNKLAEKRAALISHAVTKGLDPSVPMKDSGVAWLGEIPSHWKAKRLKFVISEPLKYGANEAAELTDPDLPRYIRITDVNDDGSLRDETFRSLPQDVAESYLLSDGDILLARSGATVGKSFIYRPSWGVAAYAGYLIRARMSDIMEADFAFLFFQSSCYWEWLNSIFIQATIQNVSAEKYANLVVPIPPANEQSGIVSDLLNQLDKINSQRAKASLVIDRLTEYRSAIITNTVTGKIDVRHMPIEEPSEAQAWS